MQLAADPILIELAGEAYELRPTLRAAMRLARRYGDFATVYKGILADNLTITADVIREGTGSAQAASDFLIEADLCGLRDRLARCKLPLLRFTLALAGHDDASAEQPQEASTPVPFNDYHNHLFQIATGWLGWCPEDAWAATPAEILAAQRGRTDMVAEVLKAIFGAPIVTPAVDGARKDTFDRAAFQSLRHKVAANAR